MTRTIALLPLAALSFALASCSDQAGSGGGSRDQVKAVGSSTVFPFAKAVAEAYLAAHSGTKSPIIESTGTGAGVKLFCAGVGAQFPDIATASRRLKKAEYEQCVSNGVKEIVEIQVGVDGLAFAESNKGPGFGLTPAQIYTALAADPFGKGPNKAETWADVDPSLPKVPIQVFGPPSTSGTRDSLAELILTKGCDTDPAMKALAKSNEDKHKATCTRIREDGKYVDSGENDNLIVQKLAANPTALGVFGFSYLEANRASVRDVPLNGVAATYETVSSGKYPGARPLYIYVKKAHIAAVPGLKDYVDTWAKSWNPDGPLVKAGMVAAPDDVRANGVTTAANMTPMDGSGLK